MDSENIFIYSRTKQLSRVYHLNVPLLNYKNNYYYNDQQQHHHSVYYQKIFLNCDPRIIIIIITARYSPLLDYGPPLH
jgi:hypothetical protein